MCAHARGYIICYLVSLYSLIKSYKIKDKLNTMMEASRTAKRHEKSDPAKKTRTKGLIPMVYGIEWMRNGLLFHSGCLSIGIHEV